MPYLAVAVRATVLLVALAALYFRADCAFLTYTCRPGQVFSYFTIHSTMLFVLTLGMSLARRGAEQEWLTAVRALAASYLMVSGLTFGMMVLNADLVGHVFRVSIPSRVMHFMLPVYAVLDLLLVPGRHRLRWRTGWASLVFPLLWGAYILVLGRVSGWYPYFFLDPQQVGGYRAVAVYAAVLAVLIVMTSFAVIGLTRLVTPAGPKP
ncbi:Pr6Pr family membrane protein [Arthrobacter zhaoguopingii]|uniref:Pr6Pr family membrane protein n=1 Tax=Arthrobacter zhaoguopingii TaxID=2681491 RepID=UPI001357E1D8|nr:Pr6Pr family membrane protein [Arthrobacter zhaoguopingii]